MENMIKRLLDFLDASPVNFLAVSNIVNELEQAGYRRIGQPHPSAAADAPDAWHALDGRRLSGSSQSKGIYIHGGRKVVVN